MIYYSIHEISEKYQIIYADPPWEYEETGGTKSSRGMAKQHYNTMTLDELKQMPIRNICAENAVCMMWATFPKIDRAIELLRSWDFIYKTAAFVWIKENRKSDSDFFGMGAYTRANVEVCLLGISKETKATEIVKSHSVRQIVYSPVGKHSQKPIVVAEKIVELFGDVSRIELFARDNKIGWDSFGNEL